MRGLHCQRARVRAPAFGLASVRDARARARLSLSKVRLLLCNTVVVTIVSYTRKTNVMLRAAVNAALLTVVVNG